MRHPINLRFSGLTLVELIVAVTLISILTAFAMPAYFGYVESTSLGEAAKTLSMLHIEMEQYFQRNHSYADSTGARCGVTAPQGEYFNYNCLAIDGINNTYTWQASNKASIVLGKANSYIYTIDEKGNEITTAYPKVSGPQKCWLLHNNYC